MSLFSQTRNLFMMNFHNHGRTPQLSNRNNLRSAIQSFSGRTICFSCQPKASFVMTLPFSFTITMNYALRHTNSICIIFFTLFIYFVFGIAASADTLDSFYSAYLLLTIVWDTRKNKCAGVPSFTFWNKKFRKKFLVRGSYYCNELQCNYFCMRKCCSLQHARLTRSKVYAWVSSR